MRERRLAGRITAALCAGALVASGACTNDDPATGTVDEDQVAGDSTGVTEDTIRIGWPFIDQAALVEAGLATDLGDVTAVAQAIVDDWNADGGINGREV